MKIPVTEAITLLHSSDYATLATQSLQMPGYPYASVVPCVLDEAHRPIFLVSMLAEHTKNALVDARAGLSVIQSGSGNAQVAARLSVLGDTERFEASPAMIARYLRYQPDAEEYLALDFLFLRMQPQRMRFIRGVGSMGWLGRDDWQGIAQLALQDEAALLASLGRHVSGDVRLLGVDCYGIDCEIAGRRVRIDFTIPVFSSHDVEQAAARCLQNWPR